MSDNNIYNIQIGKKNVKFKFQKYLGSGGQSIVYKFIRLDNKKQCAIKVYKRNDLKEDENKANFVISEYKIHRELNHKYICKMYDVGYDKCNIYQIYEYCGGGNLLNIKYNEYTCLETIYKILLGLKYLKKKKVLHLDIKPENILLFKNSIKITDFGLSEKIEDEPIKLNHVRGTPDFISPEMIKKESIYYETDIWSLGVTFYELFYGKKPFTYLPKGVKKEDFNLDILYDNILNNELKIPNNIKNVRVFELIRKMLIKERVKRINVDEALEDELFSKFKNRNEPFFVIN